MKANQCVQTSISLPVRYRWRDIQRVFEVSHVRRDVGIQQRGGIRTLRKKGGKNETIGRSKSGRCYSSAFRSVDSGYDRARDVNFGKGG